MMRTILGLEYFLFCPSAIEQEIYVTTMEMLIMGVMGVNFPIFTKHAKLSGN